MSWERSHFQKRRKQSRHTHVPLCIVRCVDCGTRLSATRLVARLGGRCRGCFSVSEVAVVQWQAVSGVDPL